MAAENAAVFGMYASAADAEREVELLIAAGFPRQSISVLFPDTRTTIEFAHDKGTKAPEGAAAGITAGGAIGGTIGILTGVGVCVIPGLGPFIAAGPIMLGLAGLGLGGAVGGLVGALVGMGIPEDAAKRYEDHVKSGGVLLAVHCDTSIKVTRAKDMLRSSGANDIASVDETAETRDRTPHAA
jgi:hypothetical protein